MRWPERHAGTIFLLLTILLGTLGILLAPMTEEQMLRLASRSLPGWLVQIVVLLPVLLYFCAPGLAALLLTAMLSGRRGVADLLRPALRWRFGWGCLLFILALGSILWLVYRLQFEGRLRGILPGVYLLFPLASVLGDEFGWRGFLQPRLLRRFGELRGLLLLSLAWSVGFVAPPMVSHVITSPVENWSNGLLALLLMPCVLLPATFLFRRVQQWSGGSLLAVICTHAVLKTWFYTLAVALPLDGVSPMILAGSIILLWILALVLFFLRPGATATAPG